MESQSYYSNGKLLITGEYAVLDGALSLALPTKFGQELNVFQTEAAQFGMGKLYPYRSLLVSNKI